MSRQEAIIWASDELVYGNIYALVGLTDSNHTSNCHSVHVFSWHKFYDIDILSPCQSAILVEFDNKVCIYSYIDISLK